MSYKAFFVGHVNVYNPKLLSIYETVLFFSVILADLLFKVLK